jgi:5-methylcytosine-specific restriction protein A
MPRLPPLPCRVPGCPFLVARGEACPRHGKQRAPDLRGSAASRGYDGAWRRLRLAILRRHPLCADCEAEGRWVRATEVHHIVPIAVDPSRRLDPTNLRPLCRGCHRRVTEAERRGEAPRAPGVVPEGLAGPWMA